MDIINETPPRYAHIDPSNFDILFESTEDGAKIPKIDRIPSFARSIQQVLSNQWQT